MNSTVPHTQNVERGLITNDAFLVISELFYYVMIIISSVGVVTNTINIKTFILMRLEDGITVSFLGLALSDLGFTIFGFILSAANIIASFEARYKLTTLPVQPKFVIAFFSVNIGLMFYMMTCMTTTFIAVARCMCVAKPFQFKHLFTRTKSIVALILFAVVAMSSYIPILSHMGSRYQFDPRVNKSRIVLWISNKRSDVKDVVTFIHSNVLLFFSSFIVAICIIVIAECLRQSVKFRHVSSSSGTAAGSEAVEKTEHGSKLSGKELQVVQQVIVISIIYTLSTIPTIFYSVFRLTEDEFRPGKRLHNFYFVISDLIITLELVNSATTFPVYYAYNSKFRSLCFSLGREQGKISNNTENNKQ